MMNDKVEYVFADGTRIKATEGAEFRRSSAVSKHVGDTVRTAFRVGNVFIAQYDNDLALFILDTPHIKKWKEESRKLQLAMRSDRLSQCRRALTLCDRFPQHPLVAQLRDAAKAEIAFWDTVKGPA